MAANSGPSLEIRVDFETGDFALVFSPIRLIPPDMKAPNRGFRMALLALLVGLTMGAGAFAERVDMPPAWLKKTATHVLIGTVTAVYESNVSDAEWSTTRYVAEVRIKTVEKGEGLKADELVYVRYWHRRWISASPPRPTTNGHRGLPSAGETLRIYLARNAYNGAGTTNDGGFDVVFANGFEKVTE